MPEYNVTWEEQVSAESHEDALRIAKQAMADGELIPHVEEIDEDYLQKDRACIDAGLALVSDALRTEPDYTAAMERLQDVKTVRLLHVAMGLATEAGEFVDALKRRIYYGKEIDRTNLVEELGDVSWYQRIGCAELEEGLISMMERNVAKLRRRFPDKFTEHSALNRDLMAERETLEKSIEEQGKGYHKDT